MLPFSWSAIFLVLLVVNSFASAQNASSGQPASRLSSFISIEPIDGLTTSTTTSTTPSSVAEVVNRGSVNQTTASQAEDSDGSAPTFLIIPPLNSTEVLGDSPGLLRKSSSSSSLEVANASTVEQSKTRDTTIFVEGTMLDENGVALEQPQSNSTLQNGTIITASSSTTTTEAPTTESSSELALRLKSNGSSTTTTPKSTTPMEVTFPPPIEESSLDRMKKPTENAVEDQLMASPAAVPAASAAATSSTSASLLNSTITSNSTLELLPTSSTSTTTTTTTPAPHFTTPESSFLPTLQPPSPTPQPEKNSTDSQKRSGGGQTVRSSPKKEEEPPAASARRVQLIELQPGLQLLEHQGPHGPTKTLKLERLFGDPNRSLELSLARLDDSQWRSDFMQASHYLLGSGSDQVAFFKVSLQSILAGSGSASSAHRRQRLLPHHNITYHTLMTNYTSLYVSANAFLGSEESSSVKSNSSSSSSAVVLLISRLGSYVEVYGLLSDHLMITPVWRHSTTVVDQEDQDRRMKHGAVKRGEKENQFYTNPKRGSLLHGLIDLKDDSIGQHMGFDVGKLMAQIRTHLAQARDQSLKAARGTASLEGALFPHPHSELLHPHPPSNPTFPLMPEVSLFVDHLAYANHGRNVDELWRYLVIYFTRLDLIFRQLATPSVRLKLRDIFIATKPLAFQRSEPALRSPSLIKPNRTRPYLNAIKAINELGGYFYREGTRKTPLGLAGQQADLMLVITGADLCKDHSDSGWASAETPNDGCSYASVRGQSFVGGACQVDRRRGRRLNVAIVEDGGYFDGILVSAHELAHLLGAVHDGAWPLSGILGPGGRGCSPASGQLMAADGPGAGGDGGAFRGGGNAKKGGGNSAGPFTWSHCSAEQLAYYARLPVAMCLYHRPPFI